MTIAQSTTTSAFGAACAPASDTYVTAPALNVCFVGCCQQAKEHGEGHAALEIGSTCLRTQGGSYTIFSVEGPYSALHIKGVRVGGLWILLVSVPSPEGLYGLFKKQRFNQEIC